MRSCGPVSSDPALVFIQHKYQDYPSSRVSVTKQLSWQPGPLVERLTGNYKYLNIGGERRLRTCTTDSLSCRRNRFLLFVV